MIATLAIVLIALLHIYILILEMFLWDGPMGRRAFGLDVEFARKTKAMAANQGLYNGFLAAGLLAGLGMGEAGSAFKLFFLGCVFVAGVFGAATVAKKIFFIQTVPATVALLALWAGI